MINSIDFSTWDDLLQRYVDAGGRVNYRRWKAEGADVLSAWLATLADVDLAAVTDADARLALWLNAYNAIAISQVLEVYPIASIRPKILGIPNWLAFLDFFTRSNSIIGGKKYSLNQIEHAILRPSFAEARIHFALVCAALGCPLLRRGAYFPESVRAQLEADTSSFIRNPDKVRYDAAKKTLYLSKIFEWYGEDFVQAAGSVAEYAGGYLRPEVAVDDQWAIVFLPYDWSLNQVEI
ncbi:DUF547 domain-containing protein [Tychonema sp. LEGE 07199]|uniref:DUF547 domain-containing protein n=1 Tax=unclassified Tychonema TaxID=2642144 RepID=UPI00188216A8|nr:MULTISPECIES: DUF547 domain-containing protein [unclassified Tychonema]MBE9119298.1 DUF547 domain-containing protein [Tychonema sp. LEGE 07199]MBE9130879.1 DUF547 domain-containing protein [Tychonema sp. LEGE 07196]